MWNWVLWPFWLILLKFYPPNLWHFEDVPIKCSKQFFYYIELICRRACEKKFEYKFHVFGWFPCLQNLEVFGKFIVELVWKSLSGKHNSLDSPVFLFVTIFPMVGKNHESCFIVVGIQKCRKFLPATFLLRFHVFYHYHQF